MTTALSDVTTFLLDGRFVLARVVTPDFELHRLYRFPGGDFKPAPPDRRRGRLDPPWPRRQDYGVLNASDSVLTAAIECRAIVLEPTDPPSYAVSGFVEVVQPPLQLAVLRARAAVRFVDLGYRATARAFGLDLMGTLDFLDRWRNASASIFDALSNDATMGDVVGICYQSQRGAPALNYGMFQGRYEAAFEAVLKGPFNPGTVLGQA